MVFQTFFWHRSWNDLCVKFCQESSHFFIMSIENPVEDIWRFLTKFSDIRNCPGGLICVVLCWLAYIFLWTFWWNDLCVKCLFLRGVDIPSVTQSYYIFTFLHRNEFNLKVKNKCIVGEVNSTQISSKITVVYWVVFGLCMVYSGPTQSLHPTLHRSHVNILGLSKVTGPNCYTFNGS